MYVTKHLLPKLSCHADAFIPSSGGFIVGIRCNDGYLIASTSKQDATRGCHPLGKVSDPKLWPGLEVYLCRRDGFDYARTLIAEMDIDEGGWTSKLYIFLEAQVYEPELEAMKIAVSARESEGETAPKENEIGEEEWA